jgi:parallel beta helix pectate lyase-like protein
MKRRGAVLLLAVLAAVGLYAGPTRAATVLVVDNDTTPGSCHAGAPVYSTIQAAVDVADPGDRIKVCPGTYAETVIVSDRNLTIQGAKAGVDARRRSGRRGESTLTGGGAIGGVVRLLADDITLDGFRIFDNRKGPGVYTSPRASGYDIRNTIFEDNGLGLHLGSSGLRKTRVRTNRFTANNEFEQPNAGNGIYSDQGARCVLIADNLFERHNGAGIIFADSGRPQTCVWIQRNKSINDRTFAAIYASSHMRLAGNTVQTNRVDKPGSAIFIGARNNGVVVSRNHIKSASGNGIDVRDSTASRLPDKAPRKIQVRWNKVGKARQNGIDVAASGVKQYVVWGNLASGNKEVGIHVGPKTAGAFLAFNSAFGNRLDCQDESIGNGTAGTGNLWKRNVGRTDDPDGICGRHRHKPRKHDKPNKPHHPRPKPCLPAWNKPH